MTVGELKKLLETFEDERAVWISVRKKGRFSASPAGRVRVLRLQECTDEDSDLLAKTPKSLNPIALESIVLP